jgi:hypothetical protein
MLKLTEESVPSLPLVRAAFILTLSSATFKHFQLSFQPRRQCPHGQVILAVQQHTLRRARMTSWQNPYTWDSLWT